MLGSADGTIYGNSAQLMVNVADWSLEDQTLLGIRARGNFNRTLPPLEADQQALVEYLKYGFALAGIGVVFALQRRRAAKARQTYGGWLAGESA